MRIVLDAHNLNGFGGYSVGKNIIRTLSQIAPMHEYLAIVPGGCNNINEEDIANVQVLVCPPIPLWKRILWLLYVAEKAIIEFRPDWIWGLGNSGMVKPPCRQSVICQDAHYVYPPSRYAFESWTYKIKKQLAKRRLRKCLGNASMVYCQTETMRKRFAAEFNYPIERIGLCPNAVSGFLSRDEKGVVPAPLARYQDRFKLFVLTKCYGHKNLNGILKMYAQFRDQLRNTLCIWTIERSQHVFAPKLLDGIEREGLEDLIVNVGPLDQTELGQYYGACDALFLPTLLESFSSTYLEAMHFGVPIITSDLDFAHEVCGDAAMFVDPWSTESMKDGIVKLAADTEAREDLIARGSRRLATCMPPGWPEILRSVLDREGIPYA